MWYVCDALYAVLCVRVSSFLVRGCAVTRRYIHICNCDMFSVVKVYLDHLKFYAVCINGRIVNKQFELLEYVFDSGYVDLQYDQISIFFLQGRCACVVSVVVLSSLICL